MLMMTSKQHKLNVGASCDDHLPILNRRQCPLFSFGVHALETVNRKQWPPLAVFVVYVSVSVGFCLSSATATIQHHQQQQVEH